MAVLTYVDDILFFAMDLEICRAMLKKLQESIEIKETGNINVPECGWGTFLFGTEIHSQAWRECRLGDYDSGIQQWSEQEFMSQMYITEL